MHHVGWREAQRSSEDAALRGTVLSMCCRLAPVTFASEAMRRNLSKAQCSVSLLVIDVCTLHSNHHLDPLLVLSAVRLVSSALSRIESITPLLYLLCTIARWDSRNSQGELLSSLSPALTGLTRSTAALAPASLNLRCLGTDSRSRGWSMSTLLSMPSELTKVELELGAMREACVCLV